MSSTIRLGPGREFDLIRRIIEQDEAIRAAQDGPAGPDERIRDAPVRGAIGKGSPDGRIISGAGGDCAVITGEAIAISVDASIEDVHFRRAWLMPEQIGYRAAAAALSDLAAVAATPIGLFVTLAAPASDIPDYALALMAGVSQAAHASGARLLGGDATRSTGPVMIDVTVTGEVTTAITRAGARAGDELWVTGTLGAAAAAVRAWNAGNEPPADALSAFARPVPRIAEARWLAGHGLIAAAIDVSDGLAGDAAHLAAASAMRILLDEKSIPIARAARDVIVDEPAALALALAGGEDYELCFAARPGTVGLHAGEFTNTFGAGLTRVGRVVEGTGVGIIGRDGAERSLDVAGYNHFATD